MNKSLGVLAASVVLSTGIGFAFGQVANPEPVAAQSSDRAVVSELRKLNRNVQAVHKAVGTSVVSKDVRQLLQQVCKNTQTTGTSAACF